MPRAGFCLLSVVTLFWLGAATAAPAMQASQKGRPEQNAELYQAEPEPLTLEQCGQCHPSHYRNLKGKGGGHRFDCRECHQIFHAYNPRRDNYAEIMPECRMCHGEIHGPEFTGCSECHGNPHAVQAAPSMAVLANSCSGCHAPQQQQLDQFPSMHSELGCASCHDTEHGRIPACSACHQPHFAAQEFTDCASCHKVHKPLQIQLDAGSDVQSCSDCHPGVYVKWEATPSKHGDVSCGLCHSEHGLVPECQSCHQIPVSHSTTMLEKFPRCLDCHLDVHDLPVKN